MEPIEWILRDDNMQAAIRAVKQNKGVAGIDKMPVEELDAYFAEHKEEIKAQIRRKQYKPQPVRRVYIPKANGKQRPLGIPTVVDRVIQQATAQILSLGYEQYFSEYSYGFRPNRDCHTAVRQALSYLNDGYEWVIDLDIEKYFDTVNHDNAPMGKNGCIEEKESPAANLLAVSKKAAGLLSFGLPQYFSNISINANRLIHDFLRTHCLTVIDAGIGGVRVLSCHLPEWILDDDRRIVAYAKLQKQYLATVGAQE